MPRARADGVLSAVGENGSSMYRARYFRREELREGSMSRRRRQSSGARTRSDTLDPSGRGLLLLVERDKGCSAVAEFYLDVPHSRNPLLRYRRSMLLHLSSSISRGCAHSTPVATAMLTILCSQFPGSGISTRSITPLVIHLRTSPSSPIKSRVRLTKLHSRESELIQCNYR